MTKPNDTTTPSVIEELFLLSAHLDDVMAEIDVFHLNYLCDGKPKKSPEHIAKTENAAGRIHLLTGQLKIITTEIMGEATRWKEGYRIKR